MTAVPVGAQVSDDGRWWWDGEQWQEAASGPDAATAGAVGAAGAAGPSPDHPFHPDVHGPFDPARHGEFDPHRHGEFRPQLHGAFRPQLHGAFHPAVHGAHDPARHGAFDPSIHGDAAAAGVAGGIGYSVDWAAYPVLHALLSSQSFDDFAATRDIDLTALQETAHDQYERLKAGVLLTETCMQGTPIDQLSVETTLMVLATLQEVGQGVETLLHEAAETLHHAGKHEAAAVQQSADALRDEIYALLAVLHALHHS